MRAPDVTGLFDRLNRFTWLMDLYADNFRRLQELTDFDALTPGVFLSEGQDGLLLRLEVMARHHYTLELKLSYTLRDDRTGALDPSAMIRIYLDSAQAEVSHCYIGRRWQDVLGIHPSPGQMVSHRLRMNGFLNKWLLYLKQQQHGRSSWQAEPPIMEFTGS
ncbi:DUF1249 domain-containing protein [Arenimonas sp.]|jgi:uncharacterized protein YqiB (DUF1249 family)|uniref:DUF1249 domain-containing protein n=1 Tax=Arenimonas sp. TaxID=1872635 RepID=UPI0037BE24AF